MIVLDTNVLSELMRPAPSAVVARWVAAQSRPSVFTTTLTEAAIWYGIELLTPGARRADLQRAAEGLFGEDMQGRVLPFDRAAARCFATVAAARRRLGRPITSVDAQIAAIASSRGAVVATRNTRDFEGCGVDLVDPWSG